MSDDEKYKAEFDLFWNDLEKLEGHQRSPSNKNARKAYVAGRKHFEAEIENLRLVKSNQSDIIDNKSSKIKARDQRIAELEALVRGFLDSNICNGSCYRQNRLGKLCEHQELEEKAIAILGDGK